MSSTDVSIEESSEARSVAQLREQFLKSMDGGFDGKEEGKASPKTVAQLKEEFSRNEGSSPLVQSPVLSDNDYKLSSPKYDKKMQELFDRKYRLSSQRFEMMQKHGIDPRTAAETSSSSLQDLEEPMIQPKASVTVESSMDSGAMDVSLEKLRSQALDVSRERSPNHDQKMQELFNRRNRPGSDA